MEAHRGRTETTRRPQIQGPHVLANRRESVRPEPSEHVILTEACRTLDDLDRLAAAINSDGATVLGSTGQTVVNPALTEARGQRLALHRLIAALALPDDDGQAVPTTGSLRGKRAASARWAAQPKRGA